MRNLAKEKKITITFLAEEVLHITYRHFLRILSSGSIRKEDLEKLCDSLDVSRNFLNGSKSSFAYREEDFYSIDEQKKALKHLIKFDCMQHYSAAIDSLTKEDIMNISDIIIALIDSPDDFYKIVNMELIEKIHFKKNEDWNKQIKKVTDTAISMTKNETI